MAVLYRFREFLTAIADAIRQQTGGTDPIKALDMPNIIKTLAVKMPGVGGVNYLAFDANGYATEAEVWGQCSGMDFYARSSGTLKFTKLIIKEEIEEIPASYCYNLNSLVELRIPFTLKKIGANAFYNNSALTQIVLSDGRTNQIPEGITEIPENAFKDCKVNGLKLHDGITSVGEGGFGNVPLGIDKLPESLKTVGYVGFANTGATFKTIPASVTSLASQAFSQNPGLTEITFTGTPTTVHSTAFSNCVNIKTINVPWAEGAVSGAPWGATNAVINYNYTEGDIV